MTLKMTTAQVVETSVTVTNSSFQNYTHPDDHTTQTTFIECSFMKTYVRNVLQWFNATAACQINPTTEEMSEMFFGVTPNSYDKKITRKFNYTVLFMRYYLYSSKLSDKSICLQEFTAKLQNKDRRENIS